MKQVNSLEYIFEFSADGILLTDIKGYITDANKSFEEMLGYKKEELEGMNTSKLFSPDLKEQDITREIIEQLKGGEIQSAATRYNWLKKDGESILVELNTALLKDEGYNIIGTISNVRDISKRMVVEEELKQRNRALRILNTIICFLNKFLNVGELLDNALEKVIEIMKIEAGALLLLNDANNTFTVETSKGFSPGFVSNVLNIDAEKHIIGKTICSGDYFLIDDIETSKTPDTEWLISKNISNFLCIPMKTRRKVYGMMMFGHRHLRFFTELDIELLENIGDQIALSIENSLLYKEMRDSEEKYRLLTESANIGIISFTKEGSIFQFNKKAEDIFGFYRNEIINNPAKEILSEKHEQIIKKISKKYMSLGKHDSLERPIIEYGRGKDGNTIPLEISYSVWGERQNPLITATVKDMR
jgi:PAS domain S-box-containing protein